MKYMVEETWVGPYDSFPSCKYCRHVGCVYMDKSLTGVAPCYRCGWNPEVSRERLKEKYGVKALKFLSVPKKRVKRHA